VPGIKADSPWSHRAWVEERGIGFPLLADFNKEVIERHGVSNKAGFAERSYFVTDGDGVARAKRVEQSPRDQPEAEAVPDDLDKAL